MHDCPCFVAACLKIIRKKKGKKIEPNREFLPELIHMHLALFTLFCYFLKDFDVTYVFFIRFLC